MRAAQGSRPRPRQGLGLGFTTRLALREDQDVALKAVAASCGVPRAHILRDALDLWLQEWEEAKAEAAAHRPMGKWKAQKKK